MPYYRWKFAAATLKPLPMIIIDIHSHKMRGKGPQVRTGKGNRRNRWRRRHRVGIGESRAEHKVQIYATAFAAGIKKLNQLVLNCAKIKFFLGKSHNKCERAEDIKISIFEMQMEYKYLHKHEQLAKRMESTERPSADSLGTEGQPGRNAPCGNYTIEKYPVRVA